MSLSITVEKTGKFPIRKHRSQEDLFEPQFNQLYQEVCSEFQEWQSSFTFLDRNALGWVPREGFELVLERHGAVLSEEEKNMLFSLFSTAGEFDYSKLFSEILHSNPRAQVPALPWLRTKLKEELSRRKIRPTMMFLAIDTDCNGRISAKELVSFYKKLGVVLEEEKTSELMLKYSGGCPELDYESFSDMLLTNKPSEQVRNSLVSELATLVFSRQREFLNFLAEADAASTGQLSKQEFIEELTTIVSFITKEEATVLFGILNAGGLGPLHYRSIPRVLDSLLVNSLEAGPRRILENFTEEFFDQTAELATQLAQADRDNDGAVSYEELKSVLGQLGVSVDESSLHSIFSCFDRRNNGKIMVKELLKGLRGSLWDQ